MTDSPSDLAAEVLAVEILVAAHAPGILTTCDCAPGHPKWSEHLLAAALQNAQAVIDAAQKVRAFMLGADQGWREHPAWKPLFDALEAVE